MVPQIIVVPLLAQSVGMCQLGATLQDTRGPNMAQGSSNAIHVERSSIDLTHSRNTCVERTFLSFQSAATEKSLALKDSKVYHLKGITEEVQGAKAFFAKDATKLSGTKRKCTNMILTV